MDGDGAQIIGNRCVNVFGEGIDGDGDDCQISNNLIQASDGDSVEWEGGGETTAPDVVCVLRARGGGSGGRGGGYDPRIRHIHDLVQKAIQDFRLHPRDDPSLVPPE